MYFPAYKLRDWIPLENLDWDLKVVYELEKLPKNICGIKVNAAENADICLL